ncbi:hypothetical protein B0H13DRAFT_2359460 [Mycena leptocephala]|nr:hypothetical protein B0H13DRAFT_2359460 [Mycena leptocephala]
MEPITQQAVEAVDAAVKPTTAISSKKTAISPKKSFRRSSTDDTSTHLPGLRSDGERPSPGINRKVSGSGARTLTPSGTAGNPSNVFLAPSANTGAPFGRALLDTGHHATDVESDESEDMEEGEIANDTVMLDVPAATTDRDMGGNTANAEDLIAMVIDEVPAPAGNEAPLTATTQEPLALTQDAPAAHPQAPLAVVERLEIGDCDPHVFVFRDDQQVDLHGEALTQPAAAHQMAPQTAAIHLGFGQPNSNPLFVFGNSEDAQHAYATAHLLIPTNLSN